MTDQAASLRQFLAMIVGWSDDGYVETRVLSQAPGAPVLDQRWHSVGQIDDMVEALGQGDRLEGALPCFSPGLRGAPTETRDDDVVALNVLWADLDWKRYAGGVEEAQKRVRAFPRPPHCIVRSGGGFHLYWRLAEPWDVTEEPERQAANRLLKRIAAALGGDMATTHVGAVLRAPYTTNRKYDPPRTATITYWNADG